MICSRCNKCPAVVFVSSNKDDQQPKGYCLLCAQELGIKPVEDIIKRMGISPDDLENVQEQMDSIMENMEDMDMNNMGEMMQNLSAQMGSELAPTDDGEDDDDDKFTPGGAPSFPNFFNMFGGGQKSASSGSTDKNAKENKRQ